MANDAKPDGSGPDADSGNELTFGSLEELDEQLARAATAAEQLVRETGAPEPETETPPAPLDTKNPPSPEEVLSAELGQLESLVATAAEELGVTPPIPPESEDSAAPDETDSASATLEPAPEPGETTDSAKREDEAKDAVPDPVAPDETPASPTPLEAQANHDAESSTEMQEAQDQSEDGGNSAEDIGVAETPLLSEAGTTAEGGDETPDRETDASSTATPNADQTAPTDPGDIDSTDHASSTAEEQTDRIENMEGTGTSAEVGTDGEADAVNSAVAETDLALDELDSLLAEQAGGVDDAPADDSPPRPTAEADSCVETPAPPEEAETTANETDPTSPSAAAAMPDFMRELMEPGEPTEAVDTPAATADSEPAPPAADEAPREAVDPSGKMTGGAKPGVVGTGMLGLVGSVMSGGFAKETSSDQAEDEANPETVSAPETSEEVATKAARIQARITALAAPAARGAAEMLVTILDYADRPFSWVGPRARTLIGWVAIATLGVSFIVYVAALF